MCIKPPGCELIINGFITEGPQVKFSELTPTLTGPAFNRMLELPNKLFLKKGASKISLKTKLFFKDKAFFMSQLTKEIASAVKSASKKNLIPCFRLNLTSDLPWEKILFNGKSIFDAFPLVQFYDYTKSPSRMTSFLSGELPANYHLTFSRSESNEPLVAAVLASGGNVAVVFRGKLPKKWKNKRVVSGDESDLRFNDPKNVVIGLVEKGKAKKEFSGFVVEPA